MILARTIESEIENIKKTVLRVVDGAATDTRASAAMNGAQAATGVSHAEVTEAVGGAAKEIIARTAENRAWIGRIAISPSPRRASPG